MSKTAPDGNESTDPLWHESLSDEQSWASLWGGYIGCGCGGIRSTETKGPVCSADPPNLD